MTAATHAPPAPRRAARPDERGGALVIGGNFPALGVVRSLGRRGIPVWALHDEYLLSARSRFARRGVPWPADADEAGQRDYLLGLAAAHELDGWTIFPTTDEAAAMLAREHDALAERFRLITPPWEVVRWAHDKRLTHQLAGDADVPAPATRYPRSRADVAGFDGAFPAVVKPVNSERFNRLTHAKAWQVDDHQALLARYDEACALIGVDQVMVQELIPGGGEAQFSYVALCDGGRPLASLVARRTRQYPLEFGRTSTYVETIERPEVEDLARRVLAALSYTGVAEVEFKYDRRDGRHKLLDINARNWAWHTLARRAGVDFPYLAWRLAHGEPVAEVRARPGVHWVRAVTDLRAVAVQLRRGDLSFPAYLRSLCGPAEYAMFAVDDPLPAVLDIPLLVIAWAQRARGKRRLAP
ncbi:MAG TPA: ATP-grasp domain-containing protein [Thermomicrobiales bacterium]|nr:ATP-grasp domain-containing protein [Thermomicrobiales bacterium]